jgi:hypothetical protein
VVLGTLDDPSPVTVLNGKPYRGSFPLEPAVAGLLRTSRAVAEVLRGPLAGKPVVHGVLVAPGASTPFSHLDVLVTSPEVLAATLLTLSVVHGPDEVDTGTSVLWGLGGAALPRSFPARALHERSAAERASQDRAGGGAQAPTGRAALKTGRSAADDLPGATSVFWRT